MRFLPINYTQRKSFLRRYKTLIISGSVVFILITIFLYFFYRQAPQDSNLSFHEEMMARNLQANATMKVKEKGGGLRVCNQTPSNIGIALGYKNTNGWTTEGWWNLPPRRCETLIAGTLSSRYYYVHAIDYDKGGAWKGDTYLCTREKTFLISGFNKCTERGFERNGFFEVDTGQLSSWTIQLNENS